MKEIETGQKRDALQTALADVLENESPEAEAAFQTIALAVKDIAAEILERNGAFTTGQLHPLLDGIHQLAKLSKDRQPA
ncbi:MAG: hypothetical protein KQH59_15390 [Desulfobulbaceae bacterium]|nr:hypothetical protein [Desulfobulbaceae bacterium]